MQSRSEKQEPERSGFWRRYPLAVPCGVAAVMLLGALGRWPYGYYTLLRIVTCGAAGYGAFVAYEWQRRMWVWIMVAVAVLFNPVVPVHLTREIWGVIDVGAAVLLVVSVFAVRQPKEGAADVGG